MQFYASYVKFIPSNCEWYILKLHFLVVYRYLYKAMLFNLFFFKHSSYLPTCNSTSLEIPLGVLVFVFLNSKFFSFPSLCLIF